MGEEYGEDRPFLYFVTHSDPHVQEAVREGRRAEFSCFSRQGDVPDPNSAGTFLQSKLQWEKRTTGRHGTLLKLYRRLLELRSRIPALKDLN
jgi:maltooligosyltrehalose trehalohydrolase